MKCLRRRIATVTPKGKVAIQLPATVPPGNHKLVLVLDEQPVTLEKRPPFDFPVHDVGVWSETFLQGVRICMMTEDAKPVFIDVLRSGLYHKK